LGQQLLTRLLQLKKSIPEQRKSVKTAVDLRNWTIASQPRSFPSA
jgi:hypothetical protein